MGLAGGRDLYPEARGRHCCWSMKNLALEAPRGRGGYSPSCAWSGIWEAADLVLPLLFLLPWLARDG